MAEIPTSGNDGFIGYVVESGTSVAELACPTRGNELRQEGSLLYCNRSGVWTGEIGVGCIGDVWYYRSTMRSTVSESVSEYVSTWIRTCGFACMTATIYDDASPTAESRSLIGCENSFGLETTTYTAAFVETTGGPITSSASISDQTSHITSAPTTTRTESGNGDNNEGGNGGGGGGTNVGLIVGAVVGSVGGLALIIGLVFLAYRMGRKRNQAKAAAAQDVAGPPGGPGNAPHQSVVWTRQDAPSVVPSQYPSQYGPPPSVVPSQYPSQYGPTPAGSPEIKENVPMMQQTQLSSQEMSTGQEHAGWAASQPQAYPQEMYAPAPTQRYG